MKNKAQIARFGAVGALNTVLDFGLLFIFKGLGLPVELANILSTGVAFVFSFLANKKYTFKTTSTNIARELVLFVVVTLTGLWVLQTGFIALSLPWLTSLIGNDSLALFIAKLIATGISMIWNYLLYHYVVFKQRA